MSFRNRVVELRSVRAGDLVPHPQNWRTHDEFQRTALTAMLDEIGFAGAVVGRVDEDGRVVIIDGHLRSGMDPEVELPVLITDLNESEAALLLVTYDPISSFAGADPAALSTLMDSIQTDSEEVAALLKRVEFDARVYKSPPDPAADRIPEIPETPTSRVGDLWLLGKHRLLCGDATSADDVERVLGGGIPNLMVTDPPYGVGYDPAWRQREADKGNLAYAAIRIGEVANDDRSDWSAAFALHPGNVIYCWSPPGSSSYLFHDALVASGFDIRMQIIWSKPHFPISRGHYHVRHEPCWYAVRHGRDASWVGDRKQTTVWEETLDANVEGGHSTQKPVALMRRPLDNHDGDVFDPFVGSGTTLVAAEQAGRVCYAMDIEPRYVDVAVARWEGFTGLKAELSPSIMIEA